MKKKRIAIIIALCLMVSTILACSSNSVSQNNEKNIVEQTQEIENSLGLIVYSEENVIIGAYGYKQCNLYDPETLATYIYLVRKGDGEGLIIERKNPDGTPKLYEK